GVRLLLRLPDPEPSPVELANTGFPQGGASDSPRLGRRGRGAHLPHRLSARGRASAQIGLPAETTNHQPGSFLTRNQDTSAESRFPETLRLFLLPVFSFTFPGMAQTSSCDVCERRAMTRRASCGITAHMPNGGMYAPPVRQSAARNLALKS